MGAALKTVHREDWTAVRQNFQRIKSVLYGPDSTPAFGGISLTGLTENSLIYAGSGSTLTSLGAATNGQIPIGSTGTTPVLATLTGTVNQITVTSGAGSITLSGPQDIHAGADPTFIGLNITAVDSLPEPVVVGKLIHLTTNNRLYFGRKL